MTYRISAARPEDAALVRDMNDALFPDTPIKHARESSAWVAWKGAEPAGFATARDVGDRTVYLSRAGVLPAHRGNGLHLRMIRRRIRWARSIGAGAVVTDVLVENIRSAVHLERAGLRLYIPEEPWVGLGDVLYFRLLLDRQESP